VSVKAERVREKIGRLSDEQMDQLDAALKRWLDL
jgi:mRNA-degrading endonuclease toxin of MazEF toxin-antitoxin module